jgi:hypothetical protein
LGADGMVSFSWSQLLAEWSAIVADFQSIYHVDLADVFAVKSWRWFERLATRLLQCPDSFLHKALMPRH